RRHTRLQGDWSSDVCSSDLDEAVARKVLRDAQVAAPSCRNVVRVSCIYPESDTGYRRWLRTVTESPDRRNVAHTPVRSPRKGPRSEERRVGKSGEDGGRRIS